MNDTDDLKELVQKAAAGEKEAFEKLYRETCRSVYFTCHNILKDEQEAQDITQEVYLTALEQLGTLEDAGKFRPWIYRMAANKSINCLKKKQPVLAGDEQLEDMETEGNENFLPEEYALNADKRKLVLDITRKVCTEAQYQTILLYYFNELSIAEIAEIMECQEGNVKKRLSIARTKIREGVLQYEKKSGDKLYSVAVIPFLTALFTAQMQDMQMPSLPLNFLGARPKSTFAAQTAKTGGRMILKGLQLKIAVGIAVAIVAVGGITAVVVITNQRAQEASVGAQGEDVLDVADAGISEDMDTSPETDAGETEPEEDTLQEGADTADDPAMTDELGTIEDEENEENGAAEEAETEEETTTAEEIPEPAAEPEQQYTYTDMSVTMYASQTVNVRDLPSTDGNRVGGLSTNQEVNVTGQCNETGWYRFDYNGSTAYVSNNYLSENAIEVAQQTDTTSQSAGGGTASSSSTMEGLDQYPVYTWIDYGDWFLYIAPDGQNHNYSNTEQTLTMMHAFDNRYPGRDYNGDWHILTNGTRVDCFTLQDPWPQGYIDFMRKYLRPDFEPYR